MAKRKYTITVSRISSFQVEAEDRDQAQELAEDLLAIPDEGIMESIELGDSGWEVTDVEVS